MTTKLLAVDDSKTMRKVFEITLAGEKYDSTIVGSPDEALGAVRSSTPQVAVVDGHLGASSGYDLCRQIKETAPQVKVLLLSSKQRPYDEAAGAAAGVDDHFDKPFDSTKFLAKLGELAESAGAAPVAAAPPRVAAAPVASPPVAAPAAPAPAAAPAQVSAPALVPRPAAVPSAAPQRPQAPPPRVETAKPAVVSPAKVASAPPVHAAASAAANGMEGKLQALGLTQDQVKGVLALSRDVVEQVVWEVVPQLAETLIKEELARLTSE